MSDYNLLAVTGMSPQVITETLYALHQQGRSMPENIYIITTAIGKKQALLTRLKPVQSLVKLAN